MQREQKDQIGRPDPQGRRVDKKSNRPMPKKKKLEEDLAAELQERRATRRSGDRHGSRRAVHRLVADPAINRGTGRVSLYEHQL